MKTLTSRMEYVIAILFIFAAVLCIGTVSAAEIPAEEVLYAMSEEDFDPQIVDQSLFKIHFTVDLFSSYPTLNVILTPELYGFETITEADIVNWQWIFSDGRVDNQATLTPVSVDFETPGEYSIRLIACTHENVCETAEGTWYISDIDILVCPFDPDKLPPLPSLPPTPAPVPTPTKNPKIKFNTPTSGALFQTGPVYVDPNTVVQLQISDFPYDITQIEWDYGDGTSSGWVPADKNAITSHTYTTPGEYRPVVTVRSISMGFQLSSDKTNEHMIIVKEPEVIEPTPTPTPPDIDPTPTPPPQTGPGYLPFENMKGPQADISGNGLIDDFNGDGKVTSFDVTLFFQAYMMGYLSQTSFYDYNQNERLDFQDIVMFYDGWSALDAQAMMFGDDE